jgi:hypothetical protein
VSPNAVPRIPTWHPTPLDIPNTLTVIVEIVVTVLVKEKWKEEEVVVVVVDLYQQ